MNYMTSRSRVVHLRNLGQYECQQCGSRECFIAGGKRIDCDCTGERHDPVYLGVCENCNGGKA
jgi:hypothetical protein